MSNYTPWHFQQVVLTTVQQTLFVDVWLNTPSVQDKRTKRMHKEK